MNSAYHPQTDGQSERKIQYLEDLLHACALEYKEGWYELLPLVEFTYNNSYHTGICMAPFEAFYGRKCRIPLCWVQVGENLLFGPKMIQETTERIKVIQEKMRSAQSWQKSYVDHRRPKLELQEDDHFFCE